MTRRPAASEYVLSNAPARRLLGGRAGVLLTAAGPLCCSPTAGLTVLTAAG